MCLGPLSNPECTSGESHPCIQQEGAIPITPHCQSSRDSPSVSAPSRMHCEPWRASGCVSKQKAMQSFAELQLSCEDVPPVTRALPLRTPLPQFNQLKFQYDHSPTHCKLDRCKNVDASEVIPSETTGGDGE